MLTGIRSQSKNDNVEMITKKLRCVLFYIGDSALVLATEGET